MKNNLTEIFTGSDIDANYIASILNENNINCIIQNSYEESLGAGWVSGSMFNSTVIRIEIDDYDKAKKIVDEYINSQSESCSY